MRAEPTYATRRSPDRWSDGPLIAAGIERWLRRRPTGWQQMVLDVGLERIGGPGSPFAYDTVVLVVGRRCGKTVTTFGVPMSRALAGPVLLGNGRRIPFKATHTAQNLTAARQRFDEDLVEPFRHRFDEVTWKRAVDYKRGSASTSLSLDPRRGRGVKDVERARRLGLVSELRVLAPTPSTARGAGVLHLTFDEALTYPKARGDLLMAAARPLMAEMQGHAQMWIVSNITTDTDSRMMLWHERESGRRAVLADRREGTAYFEFSLPPGEDPDDEDAWWRHYPALGDGIVGIRQLRRDRDEFAEKGNLAAFTAEYLCRWPDENEAAAAGWAVIGERDWTDARTDAEIDATAPAAIGVEIDPFGRSASIVAAAGHALQRGQDGGQDGPSGAGILLEVLEHHPGSAWLLEAVQRLAEDVQAIGVDDYGPNHELIGELEALPIAREKLVVTKALDFAAASYSLEAGLREHRIGWRPSAYHEALTAAAAAAQRTTGRDWRWERRVATSQSPLVAATVAAWALAHAPAAPVFFVY